MKKTLITLAILSLTIAPAAFAKNTPNAETARLNQQQLAGTPAPQPAPAMAEATVPANPEPTTVIVPAPPHDSSDTPPAPDTNPQSTGTPSIDTPILAVTPATTGN
jgi:hypothetical protein